jgi:hypothetical protein
MAWDSRPREKIMSCGTQVALAVGAGYLLGSKHKPLYALALAAIAASGRLSRPDGSLQSGLKALTSSPELGKVTELGAPLVTAAKDAARAAVTERIAEQVAEQIESVTERLHGRADLLRERPLRRERKAAPEAKEEEPYEEPEARESRRSAEPEPAARRSR